MSSIAIAIGNFAPRIRMMCDLLRPSVAIEYLRQFLVCGDAALDVPYYRHLTFRWEIVSGIIVSGGYNHHTAPYHNSISEYWGTVPDSVIDGRTRRAWEWLSSAGHPHPIHGLLERWVNFEPGLYAPTAELFPSVEPSAEVMRAQIMCREYHLRGIVVTPLDGVFIRHDVPTRPNKRYGIHPALSSRRIPAAPLP